MSFYLDHKTIIFIDSKNRIDGSHSDFTYKIDVPNNNQYNKVCLLQASVPKSYYLIQENENIFTLTEDTSSVNVSLTAGNYNKTSLISSLTSALNTASPLGFTYSISYPNISTSASTGKLTISVIDNGIIQPKFTFTSYLYNILGFNENSINTFVDNTLISENVINLQSKSAIYINSDIAKNYNNTILQEIFSNTADFSYISFIQHDIEGSSKEINYGGSNVYTFTITDTDGKILYLNGLNVVFSIVLYRKNDISEINRKILKINEYEKIIKNKK